MLAIHDEQIAEHGGASGLRDEGLLDSALARPKNLSSYSKVDLHALAASYAYGLVKNHPFVDGNKRVSLVVAETFLALNKIELRAEDGECLELWVRLAAGSVTEKQLAAWLRAKAGKK